MIADGLNFLFSMDLTALVLAFWFFFIFELPRYTFASLAVGVNGAFGRHYDIPDADLPVSVLLVGHNEGDVLERAVLALKEQTHRNLEIVVVDDGSTDDMAVVGKRLRSRGLIDLFLSTGLRGGKAGGLNLGLAHCTNEIMVVVDIDTSLDRDAVGRIIAPLVADPAIGAVSGNLAVRNPDESLLSAFQAIEYFGNISVGRQFTAMFDWLMIVSGAFGSFRRSAIVAAGGWDVGPGDDSNLTTKIKRGGWRVHFEPHAWALTDVPVRHAGLWKQRMRWNRSLIRNRFRKFRSVFHPFQHNFSTADLLGTLNLLWFHLALTFAFAFYLVYVFTTYGEFAVSLIIAIHLLGLLGDLLEFAVAAIFVPRPGMWRLLPYVFGFSFYVSYYMRLNRLIAYISELAFRRSYQDPFYPGKVRDAQDQF